MSNLIFEGILAINCRLTKYLYVVLKGLSMDAMVGESKCCVPQFACPVSLPAAMSMSHKIHQIAELSGIVDSMNLLTL